MRFNGMAARRILFMDVQCGDYLVSNSPRSKLYSAIPLEALQVNTA